MRDERVMELDTAMAIADGKVSLSAVAGRAGGPFGGMTMVPRPMILADAKLLVDFNTATIKALQKSPDYPTFRLAAPPSPLPPAPGMNGGGYAMARLLLPAYDRAVQTHYRCLGDRRMAAAALAVRWYQADHGGQPPATLDELVPKYLPSVPLDPFAAGGRPLRYVSELERLVVYSVGENGTDEAGNAAPTDPRRVKPGRWEQLDAVFPLRTKPPSEK